MLRVGGKRLLGLGFGRQVMVFPSGEARGYHERVMDRYNNPRNVESFDKNNPTVGMGMVGAPTCTDVPKLQIKAGDSIEQMIDSCLKVSEFDLDISDFPNSDGYYLAETNGRSFGH